jgi:hypothetical protein
MAKSANRFLKLNELASLIPFTFMEHCRKGRSSSFSAHLAIIPLQASSLATEQIEPAPGTRSATAQRDLRQCPSDNCLCRPQIGFHRYGARLAYRRYSGVSLGLGRPSPEGFAITPRNSIPVQQMQAHDDARRISMMVLAVIISVTEEDPLHERYLNIGIPSSS